MKSQCRQRTPPPPSAPQRCPHRASNAGFQNSAVLFWQIFSQWLHWASYAAQRGGSEDQCIVSVLALICVKTQIGTKKKQKKSVCCGHTLATSASALLFFHCCGLAKMKLKSIVCPLFYSQELTSFCNVSEIFQASLPLLLFSVHCPCLGYIYSLPCRSIIKAFTIKPLLLEEEREYTFISPVWGNCTLQQKEL